MSKELDEFYKKYSARIIAMDDTPLVKVMDGGKFKLLSIEEYEEMTNKIADLEAKLAEKDQAIESLEELNRSLGQTCNNDKKEIERLNKEIEKVEKTYMKQRDYYTKEFNEVIDNLKNKLANYERIYTSLGFDNAKQFEDYVQFTMMNSDDKIKELRDLEAKLAEKEEKLNSDWYKICPRCGNPYGASQFPSKDENGKDIYVCSNCNEKELFYEPLIKQLEDQNDRLIKERDDANLKLAEKDRQIEQLKKFDDLNKTFFDLFRTAFKEPNKVDDLFNTLKTMQEKQDQDKISFAVEQLEKVKEWCEDNYDTFDDKINNCEGKVIGLDKVIFNADKSLYEFIDQQIKQLKEKGNG